MERAVGIFATTGVGRKGSRMLLARHRAGAGAAAAVRRGEGLVQVEVHDVHAEIAGARLADERVHVGAVHVEERALGVEDVGDLVDLALEDAERVRVGEHQRGDVCRRPASSSAVDVDHALLRWT